MRAWASGLTASAVRRADFMITGAIAAGRVHSVALKADGAVYAWGTNAQGQLGDGTTTQRLTPVSILTGVVSIAAGDRHTLAVKTDGTVWAWGSASSGRLGNGGSSGQQNAPVQATFTGAVAVAAGESHSLVLKSDGTVWSFGSNADGELGDGNDHGPYRRPFRWWASPAFLRSPPAEMRLTRSRPIAQVRESSGPGD